MSRVTRQTQTPEPGTERTLRSSAANVSTTPNATPVAPSSTRNPRRRPRTTDGDSAKTAPRRKRSKISADTFAPPRESRATPTTEDVNTNGSAHASRSERMARESTPTASMPHRERKAVAAKRAMKGDGSTVLSSNTTYNVKLLPSTPRELRKPGVKFRGSLLSLASGSHAHGGQSQLALAVTRTQAWIWEYTAHATVGQARVFDVPFATDNALPFGALVSSAAGGDVGLVLISANTGKVVFYENIERSAATMGLFPERKTGIEGVVTLFSGESVVDVITAEHAGFVLSMSSGRIVQLTLRDAQGKARIDSQFLRTNDGNAGGLFGSIKGLLGAGAWKKDLSAVHTRSLGTRGKIQVVALTEKAEVQVWDVDWSGRYEFNGTIDFRELLVRELKSLDAPEAQGQAESFTALDFAIADKSTGARGHELAKANSTPTLDIWVLVRVAQAYFVVQITWDGEAPECTRLQRLDTYHGANDNVERTQKPRLLLPRPGHTGFVAFEDAIVLFTTTNIEIEGPEAQLHASTYADMNPFEDTVYLRSDAKFALLDAHSEDERFGHASCVAFVQGAGLVRVSATDPVGDIERTRLPIKTKIEQAVFYGLVPDNCLDFKRRGDVTYPVQEVEQAALDISEEVLRSETSFISNTPTSIDANLTHRANALRALITHVRQNYPALSHSIMWRLLWDAEKIAAGQEMWHAFEEHKAASTKRVATVMDEICASAQQRYGWAGLDGSAGEELVMKMFLFGLQRLDELLPLTRVILEEIRADNTVPSDKLMKLVWEADDLCMRTMEGVFAFRMEHAAAYGIASEFLDNGVLIDSSEYAELPEFWTSTEPMLKAISRISTLSRTAATESFSEADNDATVELVKRISTDNPRLVQLCCSVYHERIEWLASRKSDKDRAMAAKLKQNYEKARYDHFRALQSIGQSEAALRLAEKHRDMHTLTELIVGESQYYLEIEKSSTDLREQEGCKEMLNSLLVRTGRYFDKFGEDWANAFFDEAFSGSRAGLMLEEAQQNWGAALTKYLRAQPGRARLCWINDVLAQKDYARAAQSLALAGKEQETMLWAKKVELSMSKLAIMAANEDTKANKSNNLDKSIPTRVLAIVDVQERLHAQIRPEVRHGIDRAAQIDLAMEKFCSVRHPEAAALQQLLLAGMERILDHQVLSVEELIDVLTLMDGIPESDDPDLQQLAGAEFFLALQALEAAAPDLSQTRHETLLQLIWKRCFLADDWVAINKHQKTKGSSEETLSDALRATAAWNTLYLFYESPISSDSGSVRFLPPSACLGAGCASSDLAYRFPHNDDLLQPILHDNKVEDDKLQSLVADRRLDAWVERCDSDAKLVTDEQRALLKEDTAKKIAEDKAAVLALTVDRFQLEKDGRNGVRVQQMFDGAESEDEREEIAVAGREVQMLM